MRRTAIGATVVVLASACLAGEVGFLEDFALARDRSAPLQQLIPGTEDFYHYQCLHHQNSGRLGDADQVLAAWLKRHGRTDRVRVMENRQALLKYEKDPKASLDYIRQELGLLLNHQREILGQKPQLPTTLDPKLISREALTQKAFREHPQTLGGFADSALDWLIATDLSPELRRQLIHRLGRPDHANLPKLVVDDLNFRDSGGFGSHPIHQRLLLPQLEECVKLKPDLLNQTNFVNAYLTKLGPSPDADWEHDAKEREAYLDRLWAFVSRLNPSHNSLIAHVLYNRLVHDRAQGVYDKERFLAYVKLPRNAPYINQDYFARHEHRNQAADLSADLHQVTLLPAVGSDEPLVRSYLAHFFVAEDSIKPYDTYINDVYLKELLAETKIVNGLGDMEQWYSMLPAEKYQALKERVDIDFDPASKTVFGPDDPVALDLHVKNVKSLLVKVYEINALSYYLADRREVDTAIDLDGLVANEEATYTYAEPALRRVTRHFEFPKLARRGVFVVELIGNGRSSRALLRKGKLRFLERTSAAGHVFTILDEANRKLPDAALWLAGHRYTPDKDGTITVPFTNAPGKQAIVLTHGDFASLDQFRHESERYRLSAGIYVDREALLRRKTATVVVRPRLCVNDTPVALSLLEEPTLVITSTDREGVSTTKEVKGFQLHEDRESTYAFQVPENLVVLHFTLKAKVQNLSQAKKEDLQASEHFTLNGIDRTEKIEQLLLSHVGGQYVLDVLGKTGEPKPDRPVEIELRHGDFQVSVNVSLQTDRNGRIALGALPDIVSVRAKCPEDVRHQGWPLVRDDHSYPDSVHARAGETILLPYMGRAEKPLRSELSLLEKRGEAFVQDRFEALSLKNGFLQIQGLPAGDYDLLLKDQGKHIAVRVSQGTPGEGYVLSDHRLLEVRNAKPLQIAAVEADAESVRVRLENASKLARVHVIATRYLPAHSLYGTLGAARFPDPEQVWVERAESLYVTGRDIGDEYRYILERKLARKYPGNMLPRPSLLLNPWALRKAEAGRQEPEPGGEYTGRGGTGRGRAIGGAGGATRHAEEAMRWANLDFLSAPSVVLTNLTPDKDGVVTVKRADLGAHHQIHVLAIDPQNAVYRELSLPEAPMKFNDLRLADGLDPKKHYVEQKQVSLVKAGEQLVLANVATSEFETYDTLAKVHALYVTLSNNPTLAEFGFILDWPKLKPEEKREKYSKYACHELSFFLFKKDPEFFKTVVLPHLRNKKDKTFLDHWLLGNDLSGYLRPWAFGQLNVVERILLAQGLKGEQPNTARHVKDLYDLLPPDVERLDHLFKTALRGRALEATRLVAVIIDKSESLKDEAGKLADATRGPGEAAPKTPPPPPKPEAPEPGAPEKPPEVEKAPGIVEEKKALESLEKVPVEDIPVDAVPVLLEADVERRKAVRQLFRKLDKTEEWAENNYYHLPIEEQDAGLITVNAFWRDYAQHDGKAPFFSTGLAEASRNFPEMMLALAILDLPFEAGQHKAETQGTRLTLAAASPAVVFHKEVKDAAPADEKTPILLSQNFFRHGDRYRHVGNEQLDKFISDEFLTHAVYGCHVVITNPTSSRLKLDALLQVPQGAIPVNNGHYTRGLRLDLQPYHTEALEHYFYFPAPGDFPHYPVHVARDGKLLASAAPVTLHVVEKPSKVDTASWDHISQQGTEDQVIAYMQANNLGRTDLERIAWRMQDAAFFRKTLALLDQRHVYNHTLWSYGLKHDEPPALREFLQHCDGFLARCGDYLDCRLVTIDPVVRKSYQHMEYWPLVNARAHPLGKTRTILNDRFHQQYMRLMRVLSCRPKRDDDDLMSVTYYLLLQDRIEEAAGFFAQVDARKLATQLQYDYFTAYLDFYTEAPKQARALAAKYADYPVDRWRNLFANVAAQLDEIEGKAPKVVDKDDHAQQQAKLAATEGAFDFKVEARKITLTYQNLSECLVRYYLMDVELLFSRNPFVQQRTGQFAYVRPNETAAIKLDPAKTVHTFDLPEKFHSSNVMVEIVAGGVAKAQAYYSNALALQVIESYGQVKVTHEKTGKPLAKVYVKAYARTRDGEVRFYKDGYTDLRGRFDYASLNTNEIDNVERFALLVLSETDGATVREAAPPKR